MTSPPPSTAGAWHATEDVLADYAAGTVDPVVVWSVEAHLTGCARCRSALSVHVDSERLARNRAVLLVRAAIGDGGRVQRMLSRCGVPDYLLRLVAATPSLRLSWLFSVVGVLAAVVGESEIARYSVHAGRYASAAGLSRPEVLAPFLLVAPLLVLAGVAAAFVPLFDRAYQLAVAAPFSGFTLLLARSVTASATALIPVACAGFILPGPRWLPVALLLPSLAVCAFALAAATVMEARAAAITAGGLWALSAVLLATTHVPLMIVQRDAQVACVVVLCASAVVLFLRHDRFELGSTR